MLERRGSDFGRDVTGQVLQALLLRGMDAFEIVPGLQPKNGLPANSLTKLWSSENETYIIQSTASDPITARLLRGRVP